jgi:surfeit locus 1 family protein
MKVPVIATPPGDVRIDGRVAPWPSHWIDIGHGAGGPVRQNLELAPFAAEAGLALRPVTVIEDATGDNARDGLRRDWPVPDIGVATNYGYAVQWFAMSVVFLALYAWLQFIRPRHLSRAVVRPDPSPDPRLDARVDDSPST